MTATPSFAADSIWQRSADCVSQQVEDSLVILDMTNGGYIALNETAAAVWAQIEQPTALSDIVAALKASYAVDAEDCSAAVARTLGTLGEKGLVQAVS